MTERWAYSVVDCQVHALAGGHPLVGMLPRGWAVARCGNPLPTIGGVDGDPLSPTKSGCMACAALVISGRSLVERPPSEAPGGRSVPPDTDLATEVAALAELLAEVVELAADRAVFPSRLQVIAGLAIGARQRAPGTNRQRDHIMSRPRPQPDDHSSVSGHALRSLLTSAMRSPGTADHARLLTIFASSDAAVGERVGIAVRGAPRPPAMPCGPDSPVMTTAAAARYLGLAGRDSARIWLAQRGIRPVGREPGPSGQNLYPAQAVMPLQGRGRRRRPAYDPWRDAAGVSIPPGARVEQVLVDRAHGALASRLGKQAQVIRRSRGSRLVVRFDSEDHPVSIRPNLLRLRPVTTEQIIGQLEQLRNLAEDGDGR